MKTPLSLLLAASALLLTACPTTGIICQPGTTRCGLGCSDYSSDRNNCGGCGIGCAEGQDCVDPEKDGLGVCQCREGTTSCAGACAVLAYDSKHCGRCDNACGEAQVCESGECKAGCTVGVTVRCGNSCIDLQGDVANCGGCGVACNSGQSCRGGRCTFDLVAACLTSGQVAGFGVSEVKGPVAALGTAPAALASMSGTLLSADGLDRRLYQAQVQATDEGFAYRQLNRANTTGSVPNQVLVADPFVYVVNAESGTLQVLKNDPAGSGGDVVLDAGADGALPLTTVAELPLGMNTYPQGLALVGNGLWIPLYGGYGADAADAGQRVVHVSVADLLHPELLPGDEVDLHALDLRAFDGGSPVARPWAIVAHRGALYVALNNLNADSYVPEGPGLLARIDPTTRQVSTIDLGAEVCLNPQWLASDGVHLAVSCGGEAQYSGPDFALSGTEKAGVVVLDENDAPAGSWAPRCPEDAGLPDGGTNCPPMLPGRFAFKNNRVYLGDQNAGRVYVLELADGGLTERRGDFGTAGPALQVCLPSATTGMANVSDVLALP